MTLQELAKKLGLMVVQDGELSFVFFCFTELSPERQETVLDIAYNLALDAYGKEKSKEQLRRLFTKGNVGKSLIVGSEQVLGMVNTRQGIISGLSLLFSVNMMVAAQAQRNGIGRFMHRKVVRLTGPDIYGRYTQNPAVYLSLKKAFPRYRTIPEPGQKISPELQKLAQKTFETLGSSGTFDATTMIRDGGRSYSEGVTEKPIICGIPKIDQHFTPLWPTKNYMFLTLLM